ncbi:hypothetical protein Dip518_001380 [Parelusimicrobium proximum]|uniref:hypothetical protein n=1 Tax=Parelusimicrobium proximum TaxID=3228953 RepID=UPI003D173448
MKRNIIIAAVLVAILALSAVFYFTDFSKNIEQDIPRPSEKWTGNMDEWIELLTWTDMFEENINTAKEKLAQAEASTLPDAAKGILTAYWTRAVQEESKIFEDFKANISTYTDIYEAEEAVSFSLARGLAIINNGSLFKMAEAATVGTPYEKEGKDLSVKYINKVREATKNYVNFDDFTEDITEINDEFDKEFDALYQKIEGASGK